MPDLTDKCPYCGLTFPHQSPTGCPQLLRGIGYGDAAWAAYADSLREIGWTEDKVEKALSERGTMERDEDLAGFLNNIDRSTWEREGRIDWRTRHGNGTVCVSPLTCEEGPPEPQPSTETPADTEFLRWFRGEFGFAPDPERHTSYRSAFEAGRAYAIRVIAEGK